MMIRELKKQDIPQVLDLYVGAKNYDLFSKECAVKQYEDMLASSNFKLIVNEDDGDIDGVSISMISNLSYNDKEKKIDVILLHTDSPKIAIRFFNHWEKLFKEISASAIQFLLYDPVNPFIKILEKNDYKENAVQYTKVRD